MVAAMTAQRPDIGASEPSVGGIANPNGQTLNWVLGLLDHIPSWMWATAVATLFLATLITIPVSRRLAHRAGMRAAGHTTPSSDRRDRVLLFAALTPAVLFWAAVLLGSARGLTAFGRDTIRWHDGWEYLVPLTLDGVGISFGVLAFRAVRKQRNPDRCIRVAWSAMTASAAINFFHEAGLLHGSALGGGYLGLLSILGMLIFHELLDQFEQGADWIKRVNPKFGLRWLTWPTNTACAWVAWRNYPPAEGTRATVAAAVSHLDQVRVVKRGRRADTFTPSPAGWARILPWARVAQLDAALTEQHRAAQAERTEIARRLDEVLAEHAAAVRRADTAVEQLRAEMVEQEQRMRVEHEEQLAALRAQHARSTAPKTTSNGRSTTRGSANGAAEQRGKGAELTDEQALGAMLREQPKSGHEWGSREVRRVTGAGFSRIPRLLDAVSEHYRSCPAGSHERCVAERSDSDDSERSRDLTAVGA